MHKPALLLLALLTNPASAAPKYQIQSDNSAQIAEHKALKATAKALQPQAAALMAKADRINAQRQRVGHIIPEVPALSKEIADFEAKASAALGIGDFNRPLAACAGMAANVGLYWDALLTGPDATNGIQFARKVYKEGVAQCKTAIAEPPEAEVTVIGPPGDRGPDGCSNGTLNSAPKQPTVWICPPAIAATITKK